VSPAAPQTPSSRLSDLTGKTFDPPEADRLSKMKVFRLPFFRCAQKRVALEKKLIRMVALPFKNTVKHCGEMAFATPYKPFRKGIIPMGDPEQFMRILPILLVLAGILFVVLSTVYVRFRPHRENALQKAPPPKKELF
jgi:hypothetical protein